MKGFIEGYSQYFVGSFDDKESGKKVPYQTLGVLVRDNFGFSLRRVSVPKEKVTEATRLDDKHVELVVDIQERDNKLRFVYVSGKVSTAAKAA